MLVFAVRGGNNQRHQQTKGTVSYCQLYEFRQWMRFLLTMLPWVTGFLTPSLSGAPEERQTHHP